MLYKHRKESNFIFTQAVLRQDNCVIGGDPESADYAAAVWHGL